uniref:Growth hormone regulated TBC protein 1a n=1 Tax=Oncorhynchus mykiss TaxID=8022 RepID=A0A8C7SKA5_ONCMY
MENVSGLIKGQSVSRFHSKQQIPKHATTTHQFHYRLEDFDYESYEELMSEYLAVLTRRSIRWSRLLQGRGRTPTVKRYVRKGVPNEHRGLVWMSASGAQEHLEKNPGYYHSLLDTTKQQHDPKLVDSIRTDLNRTFPDNVQFRKTSNPCLQKTLYNVLLAYGHHNPAVGYCQGMNFIAGYLIIITKDEEKSFWLMDALLGRILPGVFVVHLSLHRRPGRTRG